MGYVNFNQDEIIPKKYEGLKLKCKVTKCTSFTHFRLVNSQEELSKHKGKWIIKQEASSILGKFIETDWNRVFGELGRYRGFGEVCFEDAE